MRTIPGISHLLKPLDYAFDIFIKVLLQGYAFNPTELFSLPVKYDGMGLIIPLEICQEEYENLWEITNNEIQFQDNRVSAAKMKNNIKSQKKKPNDAKLQEVTNKASCKTKLRWIEASTENGASIWLTVILIERSGFFWRSFLGCNTNQI